MSRKSIWLILSSLVVVALVTASWAQPGIADAAPKYGGTLRYGTTYIYPSLETLQAGSSCETVLSFIYERMGVGDWTKGPAGSNEWPFTEFFYLPEKYRAPNLAESWELPDPKTLVFHLRKGVKFHNVPPVNGREMTADDVVASWKRYGASKKHENDQIRKLPAEITALDKYTVQVKLNRIFYDPAMIFAFSTRNLIHAADMLEKTNGDLSDWRNACGTGPYMVTDFVAESSVTFKRNPDYWRHDELNPKNRLPYTNEVKYLSIPEMSTLLAALRTKKLDLLMNITPEDAHSLKSTNPELKYIRSIEAIVRPKVTFRLDRKPISDLRVRKALSMAIDRDTIVKEYLKGEGTALSWPMCVGWGEDVFTPREKLPPEVREIYEYHPEKAKELLAEAGYPKGFTTELLIGKALQERAEILAAFWSRIGVKAKIRVVETAAYISEVYGRKYPQMCAGNAGQADPPRVLNYYLSDGYYNYGMGNFPHYDEIVQKINGTLDPVERNKLIKEITVWFLGHNVNIAFPSQYVYNFWQPWVENYHGEYALGGYQLGQVVARVWVDQKKVKK